jgi:transcriptional regulator with PAS, ATPase and Fis domain
MDIQAIKQRFGIISVSPLIDRALDIARQVSPTDLSVLVTGESGVGKEFFPQIIHQLSPRKHNNYIAVNCGAIPEGTIDSELFGHEKGSFTGAHDARKGYFEVVNGGTIFLDEVAELPLQTQVRLLRVLETGDIIKVGASKSIKTNVRVVAATNVNMVEAVANGKFREDLYYRLNSVPIYVPSLRERKDDVYLLFRRFSADFAERYRMPALQLDDSARELLSNYRWPGNVRQLKNITEQISIIEKSRLISSEILSKYLPVAHESRLPVLFREQGLAEDAGIRDLLYRVLFDMRKDITELKKLVNEIIHHGGVSDQIVKDHGKLIRNLSVDDESELLRPLVNTLDEPAEDFIEVLSDGFQEHEVIEESLSLQDKELEIIKRALAKHRGKRKAAANELGISERTLYRKIKEYSIE